MKNYKRHFFGAGMVSLLIFIASFGLIKSSTVTPLSKEEISEYTSKNLYLDLVFLEGRLSNAIPELKESASKNIKLSAPQKASRALFKQALVKKINELHPNFFAAFKNNLCSKDRLLIKNTLNETSNYTKEAVTALVKGRLDNKINLQALSGAFVQIVTSGEGTAIVVATTFDGTNAYTSNTYTSNLFSGVLEAVVANQGIIKSPTVSNSGDNLLFENLVNSIATNL